MGVTMDWSKMTTLVTGATGLVGSHLVRALKEKGARVVVLVRDWDPQSELIRSGDIDYCSVVNGDLEDYSSLERAICEHETDTVFHLGAQTIVGTALRSPRATFESNIRGSYNLLDACRLHKDLVKSVVVASSDKAYGESDILPYTEDMPPLGSHPYDVSKSCTDLLAHTYANTYDMNIVTARCGNIYGGGDLNWSRIVPHVITRLLANEPPMIRSDGKFTRDYIYVKDVVEAYLTCAEHSSVEGVRGKAFNFAPEKALTVLEIVDAVRRVMDKTDIEPVILNEAKAEIRDQYLDCTLAKEKLGWSCAYSLEDGLRETVEWYRNYLAK